MMMMMKSLFKHVNHVSVGKAAFCQKNILNQLIFIVLVGCQRIHHSVKSEGLFFSFFIQMTGNLAL